MATKVHPIRSAGVKSEVVDMTPDVAKSFLGDNYERNRNIRAGWLRQLIGMIKRDEWVFNGEPIIIDDRGKMIDGQHRCEACIAAGKTIRVLVVSGVPSGGEAYATIDRGAGRTLRDLFDKHAGEIASVGRLLYTAEYFGLSKWRGQLLGVQDRPSDHTLAEYITENHPDLEASVEWVRGPWRQVTRLVPRSIAIFCHYLMARIDTDDADRFFEAFASGEKLHAHDPVKMLRDRLISDRDKFSGRMNTGGAKHRAMVIYLIFKAWSLTRNGESVKRLVLKHNASDTPILVGIDD